jgi:outer membrane protein assembly factor BamA
LLAGLVVLLQLLPGQLRAGDTLGSVRFGGNRTFSSGVLAQIVSAKPGRPAGDRQLDRDVEALERFYQDQGFFDVHVERTVARNGRRPLVVFGVSEGRRTLVQSIEFESGGAFPLERLKSAAGVRVGDPLAAAAVRQGVDQLRTLCLNSGYPFATTSVSVGRAGYSAAVTYRLAEGPKCRVAEVRVRGNSAVKTSLVLRVAEVRAGEPFAQSRLHAAQRRLYATKLFSRVAFYVARSDSADSAVTVRFDVTEQAFRSFALGGGAETPPIRLLASAEWGHDNLWNLAHAASVTGEYSPALNGDYRVGVSGGYRVPYLILARIDLQTKPYYRMERVDSLRRVEYGIETGMSRSLTQQITVGIANRLRFYSPSLTGITNSLGLSGQFDSRDDAFNPSRGGTVQAHIEEAGGFLGGTNDFHRFTLDARVYQRFTSFFVVAGRVMAGAIIPFGRIARAPHYESFTLGGRNTLRGYDDRSLGPDTAPGFGRYGPSVVNAALELRSRYLFDWVGLVGFVDVGEVADRLVVADVECSAGIGVRVRTPIGPVRIDWGHRLRHVDARDWGRVYLGLLHAF